MAIRKYILYVTLSILVIFLLVKAVNLYSKTIKVTSYNIQDIKSEIENFGRGDLKGKIVIRDTVAIDNKILVIYTIDNKNNTIGESELTKKIENCYQVNYTGGGHYFSYNIRETNKGKYLIIRGKRYGNKINYIKATGEGKEYKFDIPNKEYFILYCAVPQQTKREFPDDFKLFDTQNNDITMDFFRNISSE